MVGRSDSAVVGDVLGISDGNRERDAVGEVLEDILGEVLKDELGMLDGNLEGVLLGVPDSNELGELL